MKNDNPNTNQNNSSQKNPEHISSLTQEKATESNAIQMPKIELPKGGGALKGIDEKFEVNAANGTANFSIPLPITPGRAGFQPQLGLSYSSGAGNSEFGLGWSLSLPSIQIKTDKQLPTYGAYDKEDIYMFTGVEDLVPMLKRDNNDNWVVQEKTIGVYRIKRYRPRIESGFSKIEKIATAGQVWWRVTSKDNVTTYFGTSDNCRLFDPANPDRIYKWLPSFQHDDKGNILHFQYKKEDRINVPNDLHETHRLRGDQKFSNIYLKSVQYGNKKPWYIDESDPFIAPTYNKGYFFQLVLDYGEHTDPVNPIIESDTWNSRVDPFSHYKSGFEIRTYRQCERAMIFHSFEGENRYLNSNLDFGKDVLVRSLELNYIDSSINGSGQRELTYLSSFIQRGHIQLPDGTYSSKALPEVTFQYQQLEWNKTIKDVDEESIVHAPVGLTNNYQWVDLYSEGISGILTEQSEGWFYKSNLGVDIDGRLNFSKAKQVAPKPSFTGIANGVLSLQDLDSNGKKQLTMNSSEMSGYFELSPEEEWQNFKPFHETINRDLQDPNIRMLDLTGDGRPEIVISEDNVFIWYESAGTKGYKKAYKSLKSFDEEAGPALIFNDQLQSIYLADMSGDGLTDLVRIKNGEVCYWPNMGYGKFGQKVTMSNVPLFHSPDLYNPQYLQLADVSGTGATDIIYLGTDQFKAYINDSGNSFSNAELIDPFLPINSSTKVTVTDLLGTGTSCIVWSSDLPEHHRRPMRYIDLMNSKKPHVMIAYENGMGRRTTVEYKSSTHYYLEDKKAGKPWITKLPFPVQVISKRTMQDLVADTTLSSTYTYHHGYYDHEEREFRGFGRVEAKDTEDFNVIPVDSLIQTFDPELVQAPVVTKTWYHTGAFIDKKKILDHFENEYWYELYNEAFTNDSLNPNEPRLPDAFIDPAIQSLSGSEYREALRACKGMVLRQEIFSLEKNEDNDINLQKLKAKPYTVATHNCHIRLIQPKQENTYGVFQVLESEALTLSYERKTEDPRIAHSMNLEVDDLGNVLRSAAIVYPRNKTKADGFFDDLIQQNTDYHKDILDNDLVEQQKLQSAFISNLNAAKEAQFKEHIIITENSFAKYSASVQDIDTDIAYRLRLPCEAITMEFTGATKAGDIYSLKEVRDQLVTAASNTPLEYHLPADGSLQLRIIEHVTTRYLNNNLNPRQACRFDSLGLGYESYQLALTQNLIKAVYNKSGTELKDIAGNSISSSFLAQGKYYDLNSDGNGWIRSGHTVFKEGSETIAAVKDRFFAPIKFKDPYGTETVVYYDKETLSSGTRQNNGYYLFVRKSVDALENKMLVDQFNYRAMSPMRMIDINANPSSVLIDELGLVKALIAEGNYKYLRSNSDSIVEIQKADETGILKEYAKTWEESKVDEIWDAANGRIVAKSNQIRTACRSLLSKATMRYVYDFHAWNEGRGINSAISIAREQHANETSQSKLNISFIYTDGGGNALLTKVQAEPGDAFYMNAGVKTSINTAPYLRWIGNGRTILNNKGNPVKQYEPYFSPTFLFEDEAELVECGVTPILYYDPMDRVVKTKFPDGTLARTAFDIWHQKIFDQNDTILESDWYAQRTDASHPEFITDVDDQAAAQKTVPHADTPNSLILDSLGRPILSISDNGKDGSKSRLYATFIEIDIEGNAREVIDARGNPVMQYSYDILGNRVYQNSMDAGERWMFNNSIGNPIHKWDSRDFFVSYTYDNLHRPIESKVTGGDESTAKNHVFERIEYGESLSHSTAYTNNLRGQAYLVKDTAGTIRSVAYDFKGNLLEGERQFLKDYKQTPNWSASLTLEPEIFISTNKYDALNRPIHQSAPDSNVKADRSRTSYLYNEAGFLNAIKVKQKGVSEKTFVENIDYDAKGQRTLIEYGDRYNNTLARTTYSYDDKTYRLKNLVSRKVNGDLLQDLKYVYDPVGNIISIEDKAIPTKFFSNFKIVPKGVYLYDPLYRLKEAEGREHAGQAINFDQCDNWYDKNFKKTYAAGDDIAWRNYTQRYTYDPVGNILKMQHLASGAAWTRKYYYQTSSNRLKETKVGSRTYKYPHHASHGFITNMNHLSRMDWNFKDELQATARQATCKNDNSDDNPPETTFYVYDSGGQRVRKITENKGATTIKEQRYYLGSAEKYLKESGAHAGLIRYSLHVIDDTRRIAMIDTRNSVNDDTDKRTSRFQFSNHLDSACLELDDLGNVISYEEYHPYGTTSYSAVSQSIKTKAKRYKYTGKERDEETGLYYYGARYYLAWLGRWLKSDPIGIGDGTNVYEFGKSNPYRYRDPNGKENIVVVGAQEDKIKGKPSQSMFYNAGMSKLREFGKGSTMILFRGNYTEDQIKVMNQQVHDIGGNFILIDSAEELTNYINTKTTEGGVTESKVAEKTSAERSRDTINDMAFFAHGLVGSIEFGDGTSNSESYRFNQSDLNNIDASSFSKQGCFESYACRTGNDEEITKSLAESLAFRLNRPIKASERRTDYSNIHGGRIERRVLDNLQEHNEQAVLVDGAYFNPNGSYYEPEIGDTPILAEDEWMLFYPDGTKINIGENERPGLIDSVVGQELNNIEQNIEISIEQNIPVDSMGNVRWECLFAPCY